MNYKRNSKSSILKPFSHVKIIAFAAVILVAAAIPITIGLQNQSTQNQSNATAATSLSFSQSSVQANIGDPINLDVMVNPGTNLVSFIDLVIDYDSSVVTPATTSFTVNTTAFPQVLDGPTTNCNGTQCTLEIQLSIGSNPTNALTTTTKVGTVNFQATANGTMQLAFDNQTSVLSIGSNDAPNENVLSSSTPTSITVGTGIGNTPIPTQPTTDTPTPTIGNNPTPTTGDTPIPTQGNVTPTPTGKQVTPTPTAGVCNDKNLKLREKLEDLRERNEKLREKLEDLREKGNKQNGNGNNGKNKATTLPKSKAHGACMGSFDPNNPNASTNCAVTNTSDNSWLGNITGFFQNLFGGSTQ